MSEYRGHVITPDFTNFRTATKVTHVTYSVNKGPTIIHEGTLLGPFSSIKEASEAVEENARLWIDQHGT